MDFGNCNWRGTVVAYKNGVEIASVGSSATHKIEFEFVDGDVIKIKAFGFAIIQFDDLKIELQGEFDCMFEVSLGELSGEFCESG